MIFIPKHERFNSNIWRNIYIDLLGEVSGTDSWKIGFLWLRNIDENESLTDKPSVVVSADQWTQYNISFTVDKTNIGTRLMFQMGDEDFTMAEGTESVQLYFDNIELKKQ